MAIDGIIIRAINRNLQNYVPAKINKITQVSDDEIIFVLHTHHDNQKLLISCHSSYNRINITNQSFKNFETPNNFIMVLRKHIDGAIIKNISQIGLDRIIRFELEVRDELSDYHNYFIYIELMGKYANLILVDDVGKIVDALKRIPPFENSSRTIHPGAIYTLPKAHVDKLNPFEINDVDLNQSLVKQFHGFSPLLSDEVSYRLKHHEKFKDIMNEIDNSDTLYVYGKEFHLIKLTHLNKQYKTYHLSDGLDHLYSDLEEQVRIKQQSGDINRLIKKELKRNKNKLVKLQLTLKEAKDLYKYRKKGDLIYAYAHEFPYNEKAITVKDFETGKDITIELDNKISVKQNGKKFYQKYTKSKTAQIEVSKQIDLCEKEITYFDNLESQLKLANVNDALEIKEELIRLGYLKVKQTKGKKKVKKPNFIWLIVDDVNIYVGKNNLQNDYITFKQAKKDDTWLHVKDMHGSHVVINSENVSEELLRIGALFAVYYSQGKNSSSVPVNYCLVKQLKKIKNAKSGFVTLTNYQTIYVDPDEKIIEEYLNKYEKK